jgi:hypothetical protein
VLERWVIDREELGEALAAPDVAGVPAAGARDGIGGGRRGLGAGAVVSHWYEAATVEVLAMDYRRIVELVAATWVRAGARRGKHHQWGTGDGRAAAHAIRSPRGSPVRNSRVGKPGTNPGVISQASSPWPG